jgi:hypothetical protein
LLVLVAKTRLNPETGRLALRHEISCFTNYNVRFHTAFVDKMAAVGFESCASKALRPGCWFKNAGSMMSHTSLGLLALTNITMHTFRVLKPHYKKNPNNFHTLKLHLLLSFLNSSVSSIAMTYTAPIPSPNQLAHTI